MRTHGYFRKNAQRAEYERQERALWKDLKKDMFPALFVKENWRRFRYQAYWRSQGIMPMKNTHTFKDHSNGKIYN